MISNMNRAALEVMLTGVDERLNSPTTMAICLHLALPESGYASPGALHRLAFYQAQSRCFIMPRCLYNVRKRMNAPGDPPTGSVPGHLVRDIVLPEFSRRGFVPTPWLQATTG
jgi:hypothetical protein